MMFSLFLKQINWESEDTIWFYIIHFVEIDQNEFYKYSMKCCRFSIGLDNSCKINGHLQKRNEQSFKFTL